MKFCIKDLFSKWDKIQRKLKIIHCTYHCKTCGFNNVDTGAKSRHFSNSSISGYDLDKKLYPKENGLIFYIGLHMKGKSCFINVFRELPKLNFFSDT